MTQNRIPTEREINEFKTLKNVKSVWTVGNLVGNPKPGVPVLCDDGVYRVRCGASDAQGKMLRMVPNKIGVARMHADDDYQDSYWKYESCDARECTAAELAKLG